jgi:DNA-binding PadR family transcriptional regulator
MHGYEMIQEIERRSRGYWRPSPGSVYPTLQALEGEGLIAGQPAEGGRKRLHLTEAGEAAQPDEPVPAPWERFSEEYGESALDIRATLHGIMHSVGEVMRVGTDGQRRRAGEVLDRTRRELHRILAERE